MRPCSSSKKVLILVRKKDDPIDTLFHFQSTYGQNNSYLPQQVNTTLPQGPEYDSFNLSILVKIIDDSGAVLEYLIPNQVTVLPNQLSTLVSDILTDNTSSNANEILFGGDLLNTSKEIAYVSAIFNSECYSDRKSLLNSSKSICVKLI